LVGKPDVNPGHRDRAALAATPDGLAQNMRAISREKDGGLRFVQNRVERASAMRFGANGVNATVRSPAISHLLDSFVNSAITLFEIDCLGTPMFPRHFETFRDPVDRDDTAGAEHPRALNAELAYGPATPDGDRVARFDLCIFRSHVTGWKNVGQEKHLFIG